MNFNDVNIEQAFELVSLFKVLKRLTYSKCGIRIYGSWVLELVGHLSVGYKLDGDFKDKDPTISSFFPNKQFLSSEM